MKTNEFTQLQDFKPTPAMVIWLDTAVELLTDNISEISEKCKVSRQSWYEWSKDDGFISWFRKAWDRKIAVYAWKLDVVGMQKAKTNHSYWRSMQERVRNLPIEPSRDSGEIRVIVRDYKSLNLHKEASHDN